MLKWIQYSLKYFINFASRKRNSKKCLMWCELFSSIHHRSNPKIQSRIIQIFQIFKGSVEFSLIFSKESGRKNVQIYLHVLISKYDLFHPIPGKCWWYNIFLPNCQSHFQSNEFSWFWKCSANYIVHAHVQPYGTRISRTSVECDKHEAQNIALFGIFYAWRDANWNSGEKWNC